MYKHSLVMTLAGSLLFSAVVLAEEEDRSAVLERIKPVGSVTVAGQEVAEAPVEEKTATKTETQSGSGAGTAPAPAAEAAQPAAAPAAPAVAEAAPAEPAAIDGQQVYQGACFACHMTGAAGAPKLGDTAAWAPRIATGKDALMSSVLNGKGAMPPKGGRPDLSDAQISAAIDYMVGASQ